MANKGPSNRMKAGLAPHVNSHSGQKRSIIGTTVQRHAYPPTGPANSRPGGPPAAQPTPTFPSAGAKAGPVRPVPQPPIPPQGQGGAVTRTENTRLSGSIGGMRPTDPSKR